MHWLLLLTFALLLFAQPPGGFQWDVLDESPEVLPPPAQVKTYNELRQQAVDESKPLVVFVGLQPPVRGIYGMLLHRSNEFDGSRGPGVVVGIPGYGSKLDSKELYRIDLPPAVTAREIEDAVARWRGDMPKAALQPYMVAPAALKRNC